MCTSARNASRSARVIEPSDISSSSAERLARDVEVLLVAAGAFTPDTLVETGCVPRVGVLAELVARVGVEERAHVLFGGIGELDTELVVERTDRGERIAHELGKLHVDDAIGRHGAVLARGHRPIEPFD